MTELRKLRPARRLSLDESLYVAERQAARLLSLYDITDVAEAPVPEELIAHLPRFVVRRLALGNTISGLAHWDNGHWCIALNGNEPLVRQRFSLAHELGHVLEAPYDRYARPELVERVADHFAACLLMPRAWVKKLWGEGIQDTGGLARRFDVSTVAMERRLTELRLRSEHDDDRGVLLSRHGRTHGMLRQTGGMA
jgi:Zn-dependent peptidase ImmA (M78 family)